MKKTLVAVAAFAAVTGAFADVTISGHVDQGYLTTTTNGTGAGKTTALAPILAPNLLTFSGNEDLGSGLKASFKMESSFNTSGATTGAGTVGNTGLTGARESWVALSGAFGTVTLGQQYSSMFWNTLGTDPNGFNNLPGITVTGNAGSSSWGPGQVMLAGSSAALVGSTDTITYALPTLVEGVGVSVQSIRPTNTSQGNSALVNYTNAGLYVGYSLRTAGADRASSVAASYDFGVAKIGYTTIDATISAKKTTDSTYAISAPVGSGVSVGLTAGTMSVDGTKTTNAQAGAYYALSKRTSLYAVYGKAAQTATSVTTTAFGVAHNF